MNAQEMIDNFLKNNEVKVMPDCDVTSTGQSRVSNISGAKTIAGVNARNAKKFICKCGREDTVINKDDIYKKGYVNKKYVGDSMCFYCRDMARAEIAQQNREEIKAIRDFGSIENRNKYKKLIGGITLELISKMNSNELVDVIDRMNKALKLNKNKKLENKISKATERLDKVHKHIKDVDWDDWDTPLTDLN